MFLHVMWNQKGYTVMCSLFIYGIIEKIYLNWQLHVALFCSVGRVLNFTVHNHVIGGLQLSPGWNCWYPGWNRGRWGASS